MAIDKELLDILACPVSKKPVELSDDGRFLVCRESKLVYRIEGGCPQPFESMFMLITVLPPWVVIWCCALGMGAPFCPMPLTWTWN